MVKVVKCPDQYSKDPRSYSLFLAGGISNCADWQEEVIEKLKDTTLTLVNPRRQDFDLSNIKMSVQQIEWEYAHLHQVDAILFYFAPETMCPITLYELGVHAASLTPIFVTCHPDYKRKLDVVEQLRLIRPEVKVHDNIDDMLLEIVQFTRYF